MHDETTPDVSCWREDAFLDAWWQLHAHEYPHIMRPQLECTVYDCMYYITYLDITVGDYIELMEVGCDEVVKLIGWIGWKPK